MSRPIYLDCNATSPLLPEVAEAMLRCQLQFPGNPASQHAMGRQARQVLEDAREGIAEILGARLTGSQADRLIFTSGGTEANNLALLGLAGGRPAQALVSAIEHPSVLGPAARLRERGWQVDLVAPDGSGMVQAEAVADRLCAQTRLVSIMLANNETGVLQPVTRIAQTCDERGIALHADAVQAIGKAPVDFRRLGVAAMTVAAHKFHGPPGIGALLLRSDVTIEPVLVGGLQQQGLRPGTETVALAVGMHTALSLWQHDAAARTRHLAQLRDALETAVTAAAPDVVVHGSSAKRLPHTSNMAFPGVDRQAMFIALDMAGVACSTGSACASGSSEPSPTLAAMNVPPELLGSSLRFSVGVTNTLAEMELAAARIVQTYASFRGLKTAGKMPSGARMTARNSL